MSDCEKLLNQFYDSNDVEKTSCAVDLFLTNIEQLNLIESDDLDQFCQFYDLLMPIDYLCYYCNHIKSTKIRGNPVNPQVPIIQDGGDNGVSPSKISKLIDIMIQLYILSRKYREQLIQLINLSSQEKNQLSTNLILNLHDFGLIAKELDENVRLGEAMVYEQDRTINDFYMSINPALGQQITKHSDLMIKYHQLICLYYQKLSSFDSSNQLISHINDQLKHDHLLELMILE